MIKMNEYRYEKKYLVNKLEFNLLKNRLGNILSVDKNAQKLQGGEYNIRSLYFDSIDNICHMDVINGVNNRKKFRIRIYNSDDSVIKLEKKFKINGMIKKESCSISKEQYYYIINKNISINRENPKLLNEFYKYMLYYGYEPKLIVEYDRVPYVYNAGNVRITLDYNLRYSTDFNNFFKRELVTTPYYSSEFKLLEVKYNIFLPDYIKYQIQLNELTMTAFSKYSRGMSMMKNIKGVII